MKHVEDVMTNNVLVVGENTPYKEIVRLMNERNVTGVPVIDRAGRAIGVISECDLVLKQSHEDTGRRFELGRRKAEHEKSHARSAADLMSRPPVVIDRGASVVEAARVMSERGVKRLPVVDQRGKIVGIVTRKDLLKVFLRSDDEIRDEIVNDVIPHKMWLSPDEGHVHAQVDRGVVTLTGTIERRSVAEVLVAMVERVDGVVSVESHIGVRTDDTHLRPEPAQEWGVLPRALRWP